MIPAESHDLFRRLCDEAEHFVIVTHINPDGDAIGSQCSLASFLRARGKQVHMINSDPTPQILGFVCESQGGAQTYDPARHDKLLADADLLMLVDNSVPDRIGRMEPVMIDAADRTLCIDHHPTRDAPWAHNIVDVTACATTALVYELTHACGWTPDRQAAEAIYVGLATDTGFFRFNSASARAHRIAAELLGLGVSPAQIYRRVYERNSVAFTRLLGNALARLRVDAGGAIASVKITRQLIDQLDAHDEDTSEITTALLAMDGVLVAALFRELADGRVKVSLRSKGSLDVHTLATEFGGGGHRNASGIVLDQGLDQAEKTVTERAAALLGAEQAERSF